MSNTKTFFQILYKILTIVFKNQLREIRQTYIENLALFQLFKSKLIIQKKAF